MKGDMNEIAVTPTGIDGANLSVPKVWGDERGITIRLQHIFHCLPQFLERCLLIEHWAGPDRFYDRPASA